MTVPFYETLSRDELESLQLTRLQTLLDRISTNPFWLKRFEAERVQPNTITSWDDFRRIPLLTKQELVDDQNANPPFGTNLSAPMNAFSRLHQTSGTTGKPMRWLDTPESWDWFMDCWSSIYRMVGITDDDVFGFPFSFGPFIGFWAAFEGAQRRGNLSLTMGGMTSEARLRLIEELNVTVICCTPTYALRLVEVAEEMGMQLQSNAVRMLIVAGEPGGAIPAIRQRLESAWGARVIDHWGMTDIGALGIEPANGPGGLLILEHECIAEILDPQSFEPVSSGELGELVITNLRRFGQPVIRYRTGDLVKAATTPCPSGYHLLRLEGGILGRADDMVTVRGNNVFPSSIDAILRDYDDVAEYRVTVTTQRAMPHLKFEVEPVPEAASRSQELRSTLQKAIKDRLNFNAEVEIVESGSLPRFELKGRRFFRE